MQTFTPGAAAAAAARLNGQGPYDAVLIADAPRVALQAVPVMRQRLPQPRLMATELWGSESNIGTSIGLRGAWFAAPSDALFNQFPTAPVALTAQPLPAGQAVMTPVAADGAGGGDGRAVRSPAGAARRRGLTASTAFRAARRPGIARSRCAR